MNQEIENQNEETIQQEYENQMREVRNNENIESKKDVLKQLQAKAKKLKKQIAQFSITFFMLAIIFAGIKDLCDIFSLQLFSWLDWIIDLGFGAVLFFGLGKGSLQQIKRIRMTTIITGISEAIPIIGALPCWTISLLWLYMKTSQENSAAVAELERIQKKITQLENETDGGDKEI